MKAREQAGNPVIRINVADLIILGKPFFLWKMEPAVVEGLLEINAFGQPNVQERKDYTKKYFEALPGRHFARLPTLLIDGNVTVFTDTENASVI